MKRILAALAAFVILAIPAFGQVFPGGVASDADLLKAYNGSTSTLNGAIDNSVTTFAVISGANFGNNQVVTINSERIFCTTLSTNTFSGCTRGYDGSTPASHSSGETVSGFLIAEHHNALTAEIKSIEGYLRDNKLAYCRSTTGNATYACSLAPALTSYIRGSCLLLDADFSNVTTATLNVNGLGPTSILNPGGALAASDITANKPIAVCYDGTQYIRQGGGGGGVGFVYIGVLSGIPATCTVGQISFITDATAGQNQYNCTATNTWTQNSIGSGVSVFTGSTALGPAFSATPTFSLADVSGQSPTRFEPGSLTGNVTSVTFTNKTVGARFSIAWLQDGTGSRTVTYGGTTVNTCPLSPTPSTTTTQQFEVAHGVGGTTVVVGVGCSSDDPAGIPSDTSYGRSLDLQFQVNSCTNYSSSACTVSASKTLSISGGTWGLPGAAPNTGLLSTMTALITGTPSGGTGTMELYISDSGAMIGQYPNTLTITFTLTGITMQAVASPAVPQTGTWIATCGLDTATTNFWTTCLDRRHPVTGLSLNAGNGMQISDASGVRTLAIDSTVPQLAATNPYTGIQDNRGTSAAYPARVAAGATSTVNGGLAYDSTANMLHAGQSAADAMIPQFTATPANNDCVKWTVSGSNYKIDTAGAACGGGTTPTVGGGYFPWGAPYTNSGTAVIGPSTGLANYGQVYEFIAQTASITQIRFKVITALSTGEGILFSIFNVNTSGQITTNVCTAVASGTTVTTTGYKGLTVSCTTVPGQAYRLIVSSDTTTGTLLAYYDAVSYFEVAGSGSERLGYHSAVTTGTGAGLALTTMTGLTWTAPTDGNVFRPVIKFGN